jgi:hypothetical protein
MLRLASARAAEFWKFFNQDVARYERRV